MWNVRQRGFTLLELMVTVSLNAIVVIGAARLYSQLWQHRSALLHQLRLEQAVQQAITPLLKELRRSGFCYFSCAGRSLYFGAYPGEKEQSCVLLAYDLNRNGKWEPADDRESEWFGFRLRQGKLEGQRGVKQCSERGWEMVVDQQELVISDFRLTLLRTSTEESVFVVQLIANWQGAEQIRYPFLAWIKATNQ